MIESHTIDRLNDILGFCKMFNFSENRELIIIHKLHGFRNKGKLMLSELASVVEKKKINDLILKNLYIWKD